MTATEGKLVLLDASGSEITGSWALIGENLIWRLNDSETVIPSNGDLASAVDNLLKEWGREGGQVLFLKSCVTCKNFQMSGMARDMGRGQRGVCLLHRKGVEVCHLCDDFEKGEGK